MLGCCENAGRSTFTKAMLQLVSELATIVFLPSHTFCQMIEATFKRLPRVRDMIELGLTAAFNILQSENLGLDPLTRVVSYGLFETYYSRGNFTKAQDLISDTWVKEEILLGERYTLTIWSMMTFGSALSSSVTFHKLRRLSAM